MKKAKYIVGIMLLVLIAGILFFQITKEDTLSEPTLKVYVKGMNTGDYWLDLMIDDESSDYQRIYSDRVLDVVSVMKDYRDEEGYRPAMLTGSDEKFIGRFDGSWQSDGSYRHEFWGEGIPSEFKVVILTRDDKLIVSDLVKISAFHSKVRFNFDEVNYENNVAVSVGNIKESLPWMSIIFAFLVRLIAAVIIKMSISEAFDFDDKQSSGIVLKSAILSQVALSILLITQVFNGAKYAFVVFIIGMVLMMVAEAIIYAVFLKKRDKRIRILTAVVSNAVLAVVGYALIYFIEWISF